MAKAKAVEQETAAGTARTARKPASAGGAPAADGKARGNGRAGTAAQAAGGALAAAGVKGRAGSTTNRSDGGAVGPAAAAEKGAGGARKQAGTARAGGSRMAKQPDLKADLRDFASARPSGWGHDDWLGFLDHLRSRGHDTSDDQEVGRQLEAERLAVVLERVDGLGPKRVQALVSRFGTLWSLREAGVDELTRAGLPRAQAEKVSQAVRES
jgi:hypothetical protein